MLKWGLIKDLHLAEKTIPLYRHRIASWKNALRENALDS